MDRTSDLVSESAYDLLQRLSRENEYLLKEIESISRINQGIMTQIQETNTRIDELFSIMGMTTVTK